MSYFEKLNNEIRMNFFVVIFKPDVFNELLKIAQF